MTNYSATENSQLVLEVPAHSGQVATLRGQLGAWLRGIGFDEEAGYNLVLAVSEAVSNAIEHAYRGQDGAVVRVLAETAPDGSVCVSVSDQGSWRVPPPALSSRGRGLLLMRESVDQVIIDRAGTGTTVTLRIAPERPALHALEPSQARRGHEVFVHENSGWVEVAVCGNVPRHAGPALRRTLTTIARGGAVPLKLDLSELGTETDGLVHALFALGEAASAAGNRLVVAAPEGTPARKAIAAAGLCHVVELV